MSKEINLYFHGKVINMLMKAVSKEDERAYLKGVHIYDEGENRIYEATDGHILLRQVEVKPMGDSLSKYGLEEGQEGGLVIKPETKLKFEKDELMKFACLDFQNFRSGYLNSIKGSYKVEFWKNFIPTTQMIEKGKEKAVWIDYWAPIQPKYLQIILDFMADAGWSRLALPAPKQRKDFRSDLGQTLAHNPLFWESESGRYLAMVMGCRI